ncbi:MAG TPA: amino acid adenylation domain-containing protein, partial [Candidatus Angelobacter sp.]|nr:amino acid adenylation domain-containing protein [Candidatus Angelobacter sp.]
MHLDFEDAYPLSMMQAGMLYHSEYAPGAGIYHDVVSYRLKLPYERPAFKQAIAELTQRHAVLRTSFDIASFSEPMQLVHRRAQVPVEEQDWRSWSSDEQAAGVQLFIEQEQLHGFNWKQPPLLRIYIHRLREDVFQCSLSFHHAILDGWSEASLLTELLQTYRQLLQGRALKMPPVKGNYRSYIALERRALASAESRLFWKELLQEHIVTPVPLKDRVAPGTGPIETSFKVQCANRLVLLAAELSVPLKTILLTAHLKALEYLGGHIDVTTGVALNGRPELEGAEEVLGLFLNTVPFRMQLEPGSWRELVRQTFALEQRIFPHRRFPMPAIRQLMGGGELFETAFNYTHFHVYNELRDECGDLAEQRSGSARTNFDFLANFWMKPGTHELGGTLQSDNGRLSRKSLETVARYYVRILERIADDSLQPHHDGHYLSTAEWEQLRCWGGGYQDATGDLSVHKLFEQQAARRPDSAALIFDKQTVSYAALNTAANRFARYLGKHGVGTETLVGVCLPRSVEMVVTLLAILKAGGAYVPLDSEYPRERLEFIARDCRLGLIVTSQNLRLALPPDVPTIVLEKDKPRIAAENGENLGIEADANQLVYVMYTSGSTGQPKGAMIVHKAIVKLVWNTDYAELDPQERILQMAPISFDASTFEIWGALLNGGLLVIMRPGIPPVEDIASVIEEEQVSVLWLTAPLFHLMVRMMEENKISNLAGLRQLLAGGDVLNPIFVNKYLKHANGGRLINGYGPTEATTFSCCYSTSEWDEENGPVPIGRPRTSTYVWIMSSFCQPVPVGAPGELCIGGTGLARGYLNRPELTAERFIPDPCSSIPGARMYKTGDNTRWSEQGNVEFLGRMDHQVKIRGFRIEPAEVETVLHRHPYVRDAVVIVQSLADGDKQLVGYVLAKDHEEVNGRLLREYLAEKLPAYMVPGVVVMVEQLPMTPSGKVDRRQLQAMQDDLTSVQSGYVAPRTAVEEILCGVWEEVLKTGRVGVNDNFFERGGHSLLGMQMVSRLRTIFSVDLPLRDLFNLPTVAGLAATLDRNHTLTPAARIEPIPRHSALPLSFEQQRLWFLGQFENAKSAYNIFLPLRLEGDLDAAALERAVREIVRRHEALRTRFIPVESGPAQLIESPEFCCWEVIDLSGCVEPEAKARQHIEQEARHAFDLQTGPLLRAGLVRIGEEQNILLLNMHHIISDAWSLGVLRRELRALYTEFTGGAPAYLPELAVQYADFASWQQEHLSGEELDQHLRCWELKLAGMPESLEFTTDRARPAEKGSRGALHAFTVPPEITQELRKLARREGSTFFMTLLAVVQVLMWRYTGQTDVVLGTPVANRRQEELEGLIGFFVNMLVLRTDLSGDPLFLDLLARVRAVALEAYAHQDLPFQKLVDHLAPLRDPSRTPLFQVVFMMLNIAEGEAHLGLPGVTESAENLQQTLSNYDLAIEATEKEDSCVFLLRYDVELFDAQTIELMGIHLQCLLESVARNPVRQLSQLEWTTAAERKRIAAWSGAALERSALSSLPELFEEVVVARPESIAVAFGEEHLSYAELNRRSNQLARYLGGRGIGQETRVGLCLDRSAEMIVALLGILKAGAAYVPLDPEYPAERLAFMVEDAQVSVLMSRETLLDRTTLEILASKRLTFVDVATVKMEDESGDNPGVAVDAGGLAYVMYTSGSTGLPKGVEIEHRSISRLVTRPNYIKLGPEERSLLMAPVSFDASTFEIWGALVNGGTLVIMQPGTPSLEEIGQVIGEQDISVLWLTAPLFHLMVQQKKNELAMVRQVLAGGDVLSPGLVRQYLQTAKHGWLINGYGPTEGTTFTCCYSMSSWHEEGRRVPVGAPINSTEVHVLDDELHLVGIGAPGELCIGGEGVARGYLKRPELTAEKFVPNPYSGRAGKRMYRTGDRVR